MATTTFKNNSQVLVSVDTVSTGVSAVMADGTIDLTPDGDWQAKSSGFSTEAATATVTVPTTSTGAITGSVRFLGKATRAEPLSGTGLDPNEMRMFRTVTLAGNVVNCNAPPVVTVPGDIAVGPDGATGASISWTASATDAEDDPDPTPVCKVGTDVVTSPHDFGFGTTTVTCRATDSGGLYDEDTFDVTVGGLGFQGFYVPVSNGALNTVKGGQTVPLKFDVTGQYGELSALTVVSSLKQAEVKCPSATEDVIEDPVDATVTGATSLRWDAENQQFVFNWKSPSTKNRCYSSRPHDRRRRPPRPELQDQGVGRLTVPNQDDNLPWGGRRRRPPHGFVRVSRA